MDEITLPSGAKLLITVAPFADAHALLKAILKSVKGTSVSGDIMDADMSIDGLKKSPAALSALIDKVLSIATSDEVEAALWKCFTRVTYDGIRMAKDLMDDPKIGPGAREDYYTICLKVIEANCKPFFKQTFSVLKASAQTPLESPK